MPTRINAVYRIIVAIEVFVQRQWVFVVPSVGNRDQPSQKCCGATSSATRRARRLAVQSDVGKLGFDW